MLDATDALGGAAPNLALGRGRACCPRGNPKSVRPVFSAGYHPPAVRDWRGEKRDDPLSEKLFMTALSRRNFMRFLPGLGGLAPIAAKAKAPHADAELLSLGVRLDAAWRAERQAMDMSGDIFGAETEGASRISAAVVRKIEAFRPATVEGLQVLARALLWSRGDSSPSEAGDGDRWLDGRIMSALLSSLLAMTPAR